ncbi:hypothetical protein C2W58_02468 [Bacillus pumilus]|uniref:Uncharacterized protein n=1 Tax=Bacillus pumilus TaxID=1408 RepID=A0AB34QY93_BACPU|nr:hypothetical protein B4127_2783 [Bacillus pumilus]RAP14367.1 hypothetical protein C2W58_02468 [Bacillus pumilus]
MKSAVSLAEAMPISEKDNVEMDRTETIVFFMFIQNTPWHVFGLALIEFNKNQISPC